MRTAPPAAAGYGAQAQRLVDRLGPSVAVVAADASGALEGFVEAVRRRRDGETFFVAPLVDDARAVVAQRVGAEYFTGKRRGDERRFAFDRLELEPLALDDAGSTAALPEDTRRVLRDFSLTSQGLLVRSQAERSRIAAALGRRPPFVLVAPGVDPDVPPVTSRVPERIVVWAPYLDAARVAVIAFALSYLKLPVTYVVAGGTLADARGDFVSGPAAAGRALERAACIIDASIGDPSAAIALARVGAPLLCASTSGAGEFLDGCREYDPWSWRSLFHGVQGARADRVPVLRSSRAAFDGDEARSLLARMAPPALEREPLVSIAIPTYNRPELLAQVLESLERQRYGNLEFVVVDDGGANVEAIVAAHPRARLIRHEVNRGALEAVLTGMRAAKGEYIGFLADDDELFPDHVVRLVDALERTGRGHGHANTVTRYVRFEGNRLRTLAYRIRHDRTVDPEDMLVGPTYTMQSILFRRSFVESVGEFNTGCPVADNEYSLRASLADDVVHVDLPTCFWSYDIAGASVQHAPAALEGQRELYARFPSDSGYVGRRREKWLREMSSTAPGELWPPHFSLPESE